MEVEQKIYKKEIPFSAKLALGYVIRLFFSNESSRTAATHLVKIPIPPGPAQLAGFIHTERFHCDVSQREVDRFPFRRKPVAAHDGCTRLVIDPTLRVPKIILRSDHSEYHAIPALVDFWIWIIQQPRR